MKSSENMSDQVIDCARRLELLVQRTSAFVDDHLGKLRDIATQVVASDACAEVAAGPSRMDDPLWENQKATSERRIEEQLEHLAQAWKNLEVEQRRLMLSEQNADRKTAAASQPPPENEPAQTCTSRHLDLIDSPAPHDAASAAMQFQKLKREIRQQTRRQR